MTRAVLKRRGKSSIELKLRYMLKGSNRGRTESYRIDVHLFLPRAFRINPSTYERSQFYKDARLYVRFNTPSFGLADLLDPDSSTSPLRRAELAVGADRNAGEESERTFVYESKMLAAVYKSLLRNLIGGMRAVTADGEAPGSQRRLLDEEETINLVKRLHQVVERFHQVTASVVAAEERSAVHQHCTMIDEHMSLLLERYLTAFLKHHRLEDVSEQIHKRISIVLIREAKYRKRQGYPTVLPDQEDERKLEEYAYREKMLKTYASEVLFFRVKTTDEAQRIEHLLYAIAAGIAMGFATTLAFVGQTVFGGISVSLFALLVVSYMLKDRIKDIFRDYFRRTLGKRFYDRKEHLYDPIWHTKLATLKERMGFVTTERSDPEILALRGQGPFEAQLSRGEAESHIVYRKAVDIRARVMKKIHTRVRGLADITIFDLSHMFANLTTQSTPIPTVTGKKSVDVREAHRVYHLNMIISQQQGSRTRLERFRLVVNRSGIKRIEPVDSITETEGGSDASPSTGVDQGSDQSDANS